MDSRYRKFLALSEAGSFSAAARMLHVTQPAITLAVASLEHALGVRLYVRRARPITLTREGEVVAEAARAMTAEYERMIAALRSDEPAERLRIGLIDSIAHLLYESEDGRSLLQGAEVLVDNSRRILRDVRKRRIDCGIVTGQPTPISGELTVSKLHDEEFIFVAAPGRVGHQERGRIDDWLATNPDSTTYRYFTDYFQRAHMHVTPIFHSASMELLRDMALGGKGTALLPHHFVQPALTSGELIALSAKPVPRPIWAVSCNRGSAGLTQSFAACVNMLLV